MSSSPSAGCGGYGQSTPLLLEVASWLAGHGFCLWEVGDAYREPDGVLATLDCFFVNSRTMVRALGHRLSLPLLESHGGGSGEGIYRLLRILQAREAEIAAMRGSRVWKLRERWLTLRARLGLRR